MDKLPSGPRGYFLLRSFLLLALVEGVTVAIRFFNVPSMEKNVFLVHYSKERVFIGVLIIILIVVLLITFINTFRKSSLQIRLLQFIDTQIIGNPGVLRTTLLFILALLIICSYVLYLINSPFVPKLSDTFRILFERMYFGIVWLWLLDVQTLIFLLIKALQTNRLTGILSEIVSEGVYKDALIFLILTLTTLHWLTLLFQATWIRNIPGWYWIYKPIHVHFTLIYPILIAAIGFILYGLLFKKSISSVWFISFFVLLFVLMQLGFGVANGGGIASLQRNYENLRMSTETGYACENTKSISSIIRNYDSIYGDTFWLGTKPPGLLVFYVVFRDGIRSIRPTAFNDPATCFHFLTGIFTIVMPILAALVLIPMYGIHKSLKDEKQGFNLSFLIYVTTPSLLLMPLIRDQFLFPLFFISAIFCLMWAILKESWLWAFVTGIVIYMAIFVSFSLLPLISIIFLCPFLWVMGKRDSSSLRIASRLLLGLTVGFILMWLSGKYLLNYDPWLRYLQAIEKHKEIKKFGETLLDIASYAFLNNMEFMNWAGLPLFILFISGALRSLVEVVKRNFSLTNILFLSFGITYLLMNIVGQTKGEVGRIWIFLFSVIAIIASNEIRHIFRSPVKGVLLVCSLEFVTSTLLYLSMGFPK